MFSALGSLVGHRDRSKKQKRILDLCFAIGEEELQARWDGAYGERAHASEQARVDALCGVLWECAARPAALSISLHSEPALQLLPHLLARVRAAADRLAEGGGAQGASAGPGCLPWDKCGGAVALLHAAAALFVQLSATPQYRQLLLQHETPQARARTPPAPLLLPRLPQMRPLHLALIYSLSFSSA
ncbi:hypothetical protein AB1Y20_016469 [Prymnesium parvum]|uniref:Uncharacterized protein n=1 Tax=Prymnesium parvum TaxID=97485 RepID=A0AB34IE95_PRYPA